MRQLTPAEAQAVTGKGIKAAEVSRGFFGVQLEYADVLAAKAGVPLADAITFHTNFHRLFAYGNLTKMAPAPEFLSLVRDVAGIRDHDRRLDLLVSAYADRPFDPWPPDRFPFGRCFACEAPDDKGVVRIHFRHRYDNDAVGPLHASMIPTRRADLTAMFGHVAKAWPQTRTVNGASWLYNTEGYRRLFPPEFAASRQPMTGPRSTHGLSTWGQFLDFRGQVKLAIGATFSHNLRSLDPVQPWLVFPYAVMQTTAPFDVFRHDYGL